MIKSMICPVCKKKKQTSRISIGMTTITAMYCQPYYDEEGNYHHHDLNVTSTNYKCSNGHHFTISSRNACPSHPSKCDHGAEEKIEIITE